MRYPPAIPNFPHMLHGGDYNPDQWLDRPEVIDADFKFAREAHVNTFSIGIFAWAALEPREGTFTFDWLDDIMDRMARQGMKAILATPSGAKPNWMGTKYEEIRRVTPEGRRELQGGRHNHCYTSPVYREKVSIINSKLAQRYAKHPALGLWHLSNEYGGECYCDLCKAAFRVWLKKKYTTLDRLNKAYWSAFWAHTYSDWEQINAIDWSMHGLVLDWKRFVSDQTADFMKHEIASVRQHTPHVPVTTNLMGTYHVLDYRRIAKHLDVVSWDAYPQYHEQTWQLDQMKEFSFTHDLTRGLLKGKPFLLMESSPSAVNWQRVNRLLKPNLHRLKSLQAVAHGSDSVQYFQWRKGRGGSEKFHGAVIDHVGHTNTRVFRDVQEVGANLEKLSGVVGCATPAKIAVIYDWENRWVLQAAGGPIKPGTDWLSDSLYLGTVLMHYRSLWQQSVEVDVIGSEDDFSAYQLVLAPTLYMLKPGVAERLTTFVKDGGTLVGTYLTGISDENDIVFDNGFPGPLRPVFGVWAEEIDYLYNDQSNSARAVTGNVAGLSGDYGVKCVCDVIHAESAKVLATYGQDFYAGKPVVTRNDFGAGSAWYVAAMSDERLLNDLYIHLIRTLKISQAWPTALPEGVTARRRTDGTRTFTFLFNYTNKEQIVNTGATNTILDMLNGSAAVRGEIRLAAYDVRVFVSG